MTSTYCLAILFALVIFYAIFIKMRNAGMKERYATWWFVIAIGVLIVSLSPQTLSFVAHLLGVQVPLNLALVTGAVVFMLLTLRMSVDLSHASEERRKLTEEIAILNYELDIIKSQQAGKKSDH